MSSNLLDFDYTHYNRNFTHMSTITLEYQPSSLKNTNNNSSEHNAQEEEIVMSFDLNSDRTHLSRR